MEHHDITSVAQSGTAQRQALIASFGVRALEQDLDLDALLAQAAAHAAVGLGVERAKVLQHRPEADDLLIRAGVGWKSGVVGHATLPASMVSPPGRALRAGAAVALEDIRLAEGIEWSGLLREHGVVSLLNVPVRVPGGAVWGVLEADAETPRCFGREQEHFLLSLASLLGAAICRLEVEAELREAWARAEALVVEHAAVLNQLAEGVIVTDRAGRIVFVNATAARLHGVACLEVAPEAYSETYHLYTEEGQPYPSTELPLARAVLRGEAVTEARCRIRRPDGTEVLVMGSARPVLGPDGARTGAVLTLHDETARDAAEQALRQSEALKRAILDAALDCIVTIDHESRVIEWNPAAEQIFGYAREAALGRDMAELIIPPEQHVAHRRGLAHYLATGEGPMLSRRVEVEALRADGSRFPAELAITTTSVGSTTLFTAHVRDITERKAAEAALAESEARLRAVADNIPQLIWIAYPDGRRYWFNRRWYEYTGQTPEEARDWGWRKVHHPEFLPRVLEGMRHAWEAGEPWEDTLPLCRHDGEYQWFLTRAVPVRDLEGRITHWFGTNTDITTQPM
jgi:PAS domain S-box-containing protein